MYKPSILDIDIITKDNRFIYSTLKKSGNYFITQEMVEEVSCNTRLQIWRWSEKEYEFENKAHFFNALIAQIINYTKNFLTHQQAMKRKPESMGDVEHIVYESEFIEPFEVPDFFEDDDVNVFMNYLEVKLGFQAADFLRRVINGADYKTAARESGVHINKAGSVPMIRVIRRLWFKYVNRS